MTETRNAVLRRRPLLLPDGAADDIVVPPSSTGFAAPPEAELTTGAELYLDTLRRLHAHLAPEVYVETGVGHGFSLALAQQSRIAIGIDPRPKLTAELPAHARVVETTSDRFFADEADHALDAPVDLGFIDGMHLFEFALRDFIHIERRAAATSLIVFDDVSPSHPLQAQRQRQSRVWTGDVWKILPCLRKHRPDLVLIPLDTQLAGLLLVAGLDPDSDVLIERYDEIIRAFVGENAPAVPAAILSRTDALPPDDPRIYALADTLREARRSLDRNTFEAELSRFAPLAARGGTRGRE